MHPDETSSSISRVATCRAAKDLALQPRIKLLGEGHVGDYIEASYEEKYSAFNVVPLLRYIDNLEAPVFGRPVTSDRLGYCDSHCFNLIGTHPCPVRIKKGNLTVFEVET